MKSLFRKNFRKLFSLLLVVFMVMGYTISSSAAETVNSVSATHVHTGSSTSGGGCYTTTAVCPGTVVTTATITGYYGWWRYNMSETTLGCAQCGKTQANHGGNTHAAYSYSYKCNTCGTSYGSNIGACTHITGYSLGCGCTDGEEIAVMNITKDSSSGYTLSYSISDSGTGVYSTTSAVWSSGDDNSDGVCEVTANTTYTLTWSYTDNGVAKSQTINVVVTDYDVTAPVIDFVSIPSSPGQTVTITIGASDDMTGVSKYKIVKE